MERDRAEPSDRKTYTPFTLPAKAATTFRCSTARYTLYRAWVLLYSFWLSTVEISVLWMQVCARLETSVSSLSIEVHICLAKFWLARSLSSLIILVERRTTKENNITGTRKMAR